VSAVAARMEPQEAAAAGAALSQAICLTKDPTALIHLAEGLSASAARMEPQEGTAACAKAAATLTQTMSLTADTFTLFSCAEALSALAAWIQPKEVASGAVAEGEVGPALMEAPDVVERALVGQVAGAEVSDRRTRRAAVNTDGRGADCPRRLPCSDPSLPVRAPRYYAARVV
jgi:hypothetical protein